MNRSLPRSAAREMRHPSATRRSAPAAAARLKRPLLRRALSARAKSSKGPSPRAALAVACPLVRERQMAPANSTAAPAEGIGYQPGSADGFTSRGRGRRVPRARCLWMTGRGSLSRGARRDLRPILFARSPLKSGERAERKRGVQHCPPQSRELKGHRDTGSFD